MDHEVVVAHRGAQRLEVVGVAAHHLEALVVGVLGVVALAPGA